MKTLVIHPKDMSTSFLHVIYEGKDWTVIDESCSKQHIKEQIKVHDRIIMLGHGSEKGLFGFNRIVVDSTLVYLLREKLCICIWCNADIFVEKYDLNSLYTGMIISDYEECQLYNIPPDSKEISESNEMFAHAIKNNIEHMDMDIVNKIISEYNGISEIIEFNRKNIYYK